MSLKDKLQTVAWTNTEDIEQRLIRITGAAELVMLLHPDNREAVALAKMILSQNVLEDEYPFPDNDILKIYTKQMLEMINFTGGKIDQIKSFREKTGVGLKDAKDAVEELERLGHISFS